jgi:hypothetical protein
MQRIRRIALALTVLVAALIVVLGCSGPEPSDQFREHFEGQGASVESLEVNTSPHEAQIMMDRMILDSHGIDTADVYDNELVHATVTLESGEEVTAVRYKDKIYTYKNE